MFFFIEKQLLTRKSWYFNKQNDQHRGLQWHQSDRSALLTWRDIVIYFCALQMWTYCISFCFLQWSDRTSIYNISSQCLTKQCLSNMASRFVRMRQLPSCLVFLSLTLSLVCLQSSNRRQRPPSNSTNIGKNVFFENQITKPVTVRRHPG